MEKVGGGYKKYDYDLVVREDAGDNDDSGQDDPKVQVVIRRLLIRRCLEKSKW